MATTTSKRTSMARDQWGQYEHNLGTHPRAELLRRMGRKSAEKMYSDKTNGTARAYRLDRRGAVVHRVLG